MSRILVPLIAVVVTVPVAGQGRHRVTPSLSLPGPAAHSFTHTKFRHLGAHLARPSPLRPPPPSPTCSSATPGPASAGAV